MEQYEQGLSVMQRKWPDCQGIAYFQAFTNTYGPMEKLKQCFSPFIQREDVCAIAIATRADCLEDEKIAYLCKLAKEKEVWVELGLQSIHDHTAALINRGHDFSEFRSCVERLASTPLHVCVHLINSLPMETKSQMIESARIVGSLPIEAVKIHMLHLVKGTQLAKQYEKNPFPLLTMEEYVDVVISQLELLPPEIIIQRLTGDGILSDLLAPFWTTHKVQVLNEIDKAMAKRNTWQGKYK